MIVEYTGQTDTLTLTNGERYAVASMECGWYRIVDNTDEDYLYPANLFNVIEAEPAPPVVEPGPQPKS